MHIFSSGIKAGLGLHMSTSRAQTCIAASLKCLLSLYDTFLGVIWSIISSYTEVCDAHCPAVCGSAAAGNKDRSRTSRKMGNDFFLELSIK
jgi:hypothetical protein